MKFLFAIALLFSFNPMFSQGNSLGAFTHAADIGKPKNAGSSTYDATTKSYIMKGSGYNIWFNRDEFHYLYNKMTGDFVLTANFKFSSDTGNAHRKIGWMIRESEDESAVSINAVQHGDGLVVMQWRGKQGENMRDPEDEIFFPTKKVYQVIQLERKGKTITMRIGNPGEPLQLVGSHEMPLPDAVLAGLFICSHDENAVEEVKVWDVKIEKPKKKAQELGIFEGNTDVGEKVKPGSAVYIPATGQYVISGAGYNIWADHDEFQFVWKKMKGDFILHTRAEFVGTKGVDEHRKVGWMVRKDLDGKSPHVNAVVHGDGLTSLQFRKTSGAQTEEMKSSITHANIIELERKGNQYTMRVAKYGEPFVNSEVKDIDLGDDVYVGLFVGSHNADVLETGVFNNVFISVPAWDSLQPYRDYLGSRLEVLEVATGAREVLYTSPKSLQAPNWTADGKSLIYNSEGLIYNFDIEKRKPEVLNTGDVKNNNNDHVLSFDGKMLGLSSGVQKLGGSIIYTVPVTGGTPKQVTPKGPSYLHGWSPDGKTLTFTGQRNNEFDIYTVPANGGKEVRLTNAKGLDDGSEYSPDGKTIYFNSNRTGEMRLWKMNADGSNQESFTNGEYHDWFPHISPDGKWILFISFLKSEVKSDDHPFYKHVYLRMMPANDPKNIKVVAYLYGGQATINTPSWSPDSKKVAFVSNSADIK